MEINVNAGHEVLQELGAFIVEALEFWLESGSYKSLVQGLVGLEYTFGCTIFERLYKNMITIKIVQNHHVIVAGDGRDDESSSLVGMHLPSDLVDGDETLVCALGDWAGEGIFVVGAW